MSNMFRLSMSMKMEASTAEEIRALAKQKKITTGTGILFALGTGIGSGDKSAGYWPLVDWTAKKDEIRVLFQCSDNSKDKASGGAVKGTYTAAQLTSETKINVAGKFEKSAYYHFEMVKMGKIATVLYQKVDRLGLPLAVRKQLAVIDLSNIADECQRDMMNRKEMSLSRSLTDHSTMINPIANLEYNKTEFGAGLPELMFGSYGGVAASHISSCYMDNSISSGSDCDCKASVSNCAKKMGVCSITTTCTIKDSQYSLNLKTEGGAVKDLVPINIGLVRFTSASNARYASSYRYLMHYGSAYLANLMVSSAKVAMKVTSGQPAKLSFGGGQVMTIVGNGFPVLEKGKSKLLTVGGQPCEVIGSSSTMITCVTEKSSVMR